ncbi:MAG TPA: CPBP family intramembrane glutamic endopeptidase [Chondromyces sp.]|nr:CPBP family intramembrane glutamic endopeptidase [Chondromyces sp.]
MISCAKDWRLIGSIVLAHLLLYITFSDKDIFWYIYTAANLFFMSFAILNGKIDDDQKTGMFLMYGILSGILLYVGFWIGDWILSILPTDWYRQVSSIYRVYTPEFFWHYIVLLLVLIPGEEIFWRGFVQKRLAGYFNDWIALILASLLYASIFLYADKFIWLVAAFVGGLFWGALYIWKRSVPMLIISHLVFDLLLLIFLPLR